MSIEQHHIDWVNKLANSCFRYKRTYPAMETYADLFKTARPQLDIPIEDQIDLFDIGMEIVIAHYRAKTDAIWDVPKPVFDE